MTLDLPGLDSPVSAAGLRSASHDGVMTVTLAAPHHRNAQTPALWRELAALGNGLDPSVRVVVLRAEGASFSAGLDRAMLGPDGVDGEPSLGTLAALDEHSLDRTIGEFQAAFSWWRGSSAVTVAAVAGHAIGAGFQLALACDLRVIADDALFSMRETSLGLVPDLGGTQPLVELVGYPRALEICATGRWVDAGEALRLGLAELVVPRDELDDAVADLAAALLAAPAGAVRETKALLRTALDHDRDGQLAAERAAQGRRLRALASGRDA